MPNHIYTDKLSSSDLYYENWDSNRSKLSMTTLPEVVEMKGKKAEFEALSKQC